MNISSYKKKSNSKKLNDIRRLKDNWNGNGAISYSKEYLDRIEGLLDELDIQPEVFPTAMGSIQLEYDNSRKDHMEIEIDDSDVAELFIKNFSGEEVMEKIPITPKAINERVEQFFV